MRLGKGNIQKKFPRLLKMSIAEVYTFLSSIDEIYKSSTNLNKYNEIKQIIEEYINKDKFEDKKKAQIEKDFQDMQSSNEYYRFFIDNFANGKESLEEQLGELKNYIRDLNSELQEKIAFAESRLFDHYFKEQFEQMKKQETFSRQDYERFKKLSKLMKSKPNTEELKDYSSVRFLEEFHELSKKYWDHLRSTAQEQFRNKELSLDKFIDLLDQATVIGEDERNALIEDVAKMFFPDNFKDFEDLIHFLVQKNKLQEVGYYSIAHVSSQNIRIPLYYDENGKIDCNLGRYRPQSIKKNEVLSLDFTHVLDEDENKIINEFVQLRERVQQQYPNTIINVLDRLIIVESEEEQEIYIIDHGIVKVDNPQDRAQQIQFQDENNAMPVIKRKDTWVSTVMRRLFHNRNGDTTIYNLRGYNGVDRAKAFRRGQQCENTENNSESLPDSQNSQPNVKYTDIYSR